MPYVTERWPGGMLTNFPTIRKAVKKMSSIDKMTQDGTFDNFSKREKLQISRQRAKLEKNLGSIADLTRLPAALFVVDVQKEANAVREANRLSIPVFAMVDTCCDPSMIDYVIPANDDATKSIEVVLDAICAAINEGIAERKLEKDKEGEGANADGEFGGENTQSGKGTGRQRIRKMNREEVDIPTMEDATEGRNADGDVEAAPAAAVAEVAPAAPAAPAAAEVEAPEAPAAESAE
jgi:small subunit ribosomal protein S2